MTINAPPVPEGWEVEQVIRNSDGYIFKIILVPTAETKRRNR